LSDIPKRANPKIQSASFSEERKVDKETERSCHGGHFETHQTAPNNDSNDPTNIKQTPGIPLLQKEPPTNPSTTQQPVLDACPKADSATLAKSEIRVKSPSVIKALQTTRLYGSPSNVTPGKKRLSLSLKKKGLS
jgi:hypothetical protein